jgi:hypothetical protein
MVKLGHHRSSESSYLGWRPSAHLFPDDRPSVQERIEFTLLSRAGSDSGGVLSMDGREQRAHHPKQAPYVDGRLSFSHGAVLPGNALLLCCILHCLQGMFPHLVLMPISTISLPLERFTQGAYYLLPHDKGGLTLESTRVEVDSLLQIVPKALSCLGMLFSSVASFIVCKVCSSSLSCQSLQYSGRLGSLPPGGRGERVCCHVLRQG